jgi:hypothetical protein
MGKYTTRLYNFSNRYATSYSLKILGINVFAMYAQNRFGWFILFGRGLTWKDLTIHDLTFSQRRGLTKYIKIGSWCVSIAK